MTNREPQRSCLGCGKTDDQTKLLRIVIQENGELEINRLEKGRGGYLHRAEACWELFLRRKSVFRAFRVEVGKPAKERLIVSLRDAEK
jgi:predicted RNA-binding protein YlxR (DUF448 family)